MHDEHIGRAFELGHPGEITQAIPRHVVLHQRSEPCGAAALEQRIAVGGRLGNDLGADVARAVIDDHRLTEWSRDLLRDQPRGDIAAAARRARHDAYRFGWKILPYSNIAS